MIRNPFRRQNHDLRARIAELEEKASTASMAYKAQFLGRAGDLCAEEGHIDRALHFWGRAIDAYLETARPDAAAAACRKVIQHVPGVVRARRTLALLSIGMGHMEEALHHADEYVGAACRAGRADLAVKQLRLMARASGDHDFRCHVAELLKELGDPRAQSVMGRAAGDEEGEDPEEIPPHERWNAILEFARLSPQEVGRY